ncbi:Bromodomain-containing protein [Meredithblackwellia eburnea MCA 4105]
MDFDIKPLTRGSLNGIDPAVAATIPATDAAGLEEVKKKGEYIWEKLTSFQSAAEGEEGYMAHFAFMRLPSKFEYPDYYEQIRKPISFHEIRQKLDRLEYTTLADIKADFNQLFVNAKRYNAPGSPIFLNAKLLHKQVKVAYGILTGDHGIPDEDDLPTHSASGSPSLSSTTQLHAAPATPTSGAGGPLPKRGPTLKPWLSRKLHEFTSLRDHAGRPHSESFKSLPERKSWPQYYEAIAEPVALDMITQRINKRIYTTVKQFTDDVELMLANAMHFNEEGSHIWQDAKVMQAHFAEVMKEVPPVFVPPRTYNTAKRRLEQAALAQAHLDGNTDGARKRPRGEYETDLGDAQSPAGGDGDDDDDDGDDMQYGGYGAGASGVGSVAGSGTPFDLPTDRSRSITPGIALGAIQSGSPLTGSPAPMANPVLHTLPQALQPLAPNMLPNLMQTAQSSASSAYSGSPAPVLNGNAIHPPAVGAASGAKPTPDITKPKLIARAPRKGEVPAIARFEINQHPESKSIVVESSFARQHSLVVASITEKIDFLPFLGRPGDVDKGKGKADGSDAGTVTPPFVPPNIKVTARPAGTVVQALAEMPALGGGSSLKYHLRYQVTLKTGLTVVEFVVTPRSAPGVAAPAADGAQQLEVYRIFVTKP